eukprot:snap_masked-scaffold_8-processed-gene-10.30-mRNA-1 protein AED:1.00 eAED:1.00 QI:0/-1/0/0/-1/1/1/0/60
MALPPEASVAIQILLAAMGYRNAKWFNSPGPQKKFYKLYIFVFLVAQAFGFIHGNQIKDK